MKKSLCILLAIFSIFLSISSKELDEIQVIISKMTLKEKVGQLFVIRPDALEEGKKPEDVNFHDNEGLCEISDKIIKYYEKYPCGGVILFPKNIVDPNQLKTFTSDIHSLGKIKPFIYIDEEGGPVSRLSNHPAFALPRYRSMEFIGDKKDSYYAFFAGKTIGEYLGEYGIDVDFAPVADVNSNPENPIIGSRAFSSDPQIVAQMAVSLMNGLETKNVYGCLKHFPGHGDTVTDSHRSYTESLKTWEELKTCELIPFVEGIKNNAKYIMVGHIALPNVTNDNLPATLSYELLTNKLRNEMGFKGIIISDAMNMNAITKYYPKEEACVMALNAGVDILLMPFDYEKAFNAVLKAAKNKKIQSELLNEKLYRILSLKFKDEANE